MGKNIVTKQLDEKKKVLNERLEKSNSLSDWKTLENNSDRMNY